MTSANFAVHADAIIPVSGPENVLKSHSIVVRQGLIDALMPHAQARAVLDGDEHQRQRAVVDGGRAVHALLRRAGRHRPRRSAGGARELCE